MLIKIGISYVELTLINNKTVTWLNVGKGAKFLGTAGNIAGIIPTAWDMTVNGNLTGENALDLIGNGISFVPTVGWVYSAYYSVEKYNTQQVVSGKARYISVGGFYSPMIQYVPQE